MSHFPSLFRQAKTTALLPKSKKGVLTGIPLEQTLETTVASRHRRDWGLKANLPKKAKSAFLSFQNYENELGFPELEYGSNFYRRLLKFQELGVPVSPVVGSEVSSLLSAGERPRKYIQDIPRKKLAKFFQTAKQRRSEYRGFVEARAQNEDLIQKSDPTSVVNAQRFMGISHNEIGVTKVLHSVVGLSYKQKGLLFNSPRGIERDRIVSGRFLPHTGTRQHVAIAGFIGSFNNSRERHRSAGHAPHRQPREMRISAAKAENSGRVSLTLTTVEREKADFANKLSDELGLGF